MVRRAEYALGKAIRAGQEQGEIGRRGETATHYDRWSGETGHTLNSTKASPTDFASSDELHNKTGTGIYDLVDDVSEQQFEEAISEAATTSLARTWSARSRASSPTSSPRPNG